MLPRVLRASGSVGRRDVTSRRFAAAAAALVVCPPPPVAAAALVIHRRRSRRPPPRGVDSQGFLPALLQGPLSRFGDTAANVGVLSLLEAHSDETRSLPAAVKTVASASAATLWRVGLMPLDTTKTMLQAGARATRAAVAAACARPGRGARGRGSGLERVRASSCWGVGRYR